jgi:Txe/YoeB family toxin of Txe-Axe toxin-antitoxin module
MARKQQFFNADFSEQWEKSYPTFQAAEQKAIDKVVMALLKGENTPGMRIKPIEPEKYYNEARVNNGDRVVHRIANDTVYFVDVVPHDDIGKYGKRR